MWSCQFGNSTARPKQHHKNVEHVEKYSVSCFNCFNALGFSALVQEYHNYQSKSNAEKQPKQATPHARTTWIFNFHHIGPIYHKY
jgi:hypothetical protein